MVLKTERVEIEYRRGVAFFARLPLLGDLMWTADGGWRHRTWHEVKAQQAEVRCYLDAQRSAASVKEA